MDINEITNFLKENKDLVFGPNGNRHKVYHQRMQFDSSRNTLKFNTDLDYKMNGKTEEVMKVLCQNFNIKRYQIEIVFVGGLGLDLDIILDLNEFEKKKIAEIIHFIKNNFYNSKNWIYEIT